MSEARTLRLPSGRTLAYAEYGDPLGRPVLALHGAPASRIMFTIADQAARSRGLRLIAPDRPGYGATPPDRGPRSLSAIAADMEGLADALRLERPGLIGISGGAPYAVATAARLGRRAAALALVSPMGPLAGGRDARVLTTGHRCFFLALPRHRLMLRIGARGAAAAFHAAPGTTAALFARLLGPADRAILAKPAARAALIDFTREALRQGVDGAIADLTAYAAPWDADPAAVMAPTLLWHGTVDRVVPEAAALRLAELIPGCRLQRLEGAGHFWIMQHTDEVLTELAAAMSRP